MHRLSSNAAAIRRLSEIEAEMARIVSAFPELRRSRRIPRRLRLTPKRPQVYADLRRSVGL